MTQKKKWFLLAGLPILLCLLIAMALPEENSETLAAIQPDSMVAVAKGKVDVEGGIVHVAASRQGIVTDVFAEEGQRVKKGEILARLDARQPQLSLDVASAQLTLEKARLDKLQVQLSQAKRDLQRMESLVASSAVSRQRYDAANDTYVNLKAETRLQQARVDRQFREKAVQAYEVGQYTIRAPLDGMIVRRMAQPGQGTSTLDVTDLFLLLPDGDRIIRAEVEERYISSLHPGMEATIEPQGGDTPTRTGSILRIGQIMGGRKNVALDPTDRVDVRVVEVVIAYDAADSPMIPGQRVIVRFKNETSQGEHHE